MREVSNAEWDDIQDRLKEKDIEIELLKVEVEWIPWAEKALDDKDAEIARLNQVIQSERQSAHEGKGWMIKSQEAARKIDELKSSLADGDTHGALGANL